MIRLIFSSFCFVVAAILPLVAYSNNETEVLQIVSASGEQHTLNVELAITPESREQGLMFREQLPEDSGMLFFFPHEQRTGFWMKNTFIPLDMIFIKSDGTISSIHRGAVPHDMTSIYSIEPVRAVLEVNAGVADRLGINPGDKIHHSLFGNVLAP